MLQEHKTIIEQVRALAAPLNAAERLTLIRAIASLDMPNRKTAARESAHRETLEAEQEGWFARPPLERQRYANEYVAVRGGEVVDHDADQRALYLRVRRQYGRQPMLIVHADWNATPDFTILIAGTDPDRRARGTAGGARWPGSPDPTVAGAVGNL